MRPRTIRDGDHLALLAYRLAFDADTVWNDAANADLRALRPDPNMLAPADVLHIPDPPASGPTTHEVPAGSTNEFVADVPTISVCVKFTGVDPTAYTSKAYTVAELDHLTGLTTTDDGVATFQAPATLPIATVVFTDSGEQRPVRIGGMDPVETLSGVIKRLRNLGYLGADLQVDADNLDVVRTALLSLQEALQPPKDDPPPESKPPSSAAGSVPPPPTEYPSLEELDAASAEAPASDDSPSSSGDVQLLDPESPQSSSGSGSGASDPAASPNDGSGDAQTAAPTDEAGLRSDGSLTDDAKALLLQAHGH